MEGWVDLGTAEKVRSPCQRLYIAAWLLFLLLSLCVGRDRKPYKTADRLRCRLGQTRLGKWMNTTDRSVQQRRCGPLLPLLQRLDYQLTRKCRQVLRKTDRICVHGPLKEAIHSDISFVMTWRSVLEIGLTKRGSNIFLFNSQTFE